MKALYSCVTGAILALSPRLGLVWRVLSVGACVCSTVVPLLSVMRCNNFQTNS
jgi:hypothetical protein